jgi:hypothetical protein
MLSSTLVLDPAGARPSHSKSARARELQASGSERAGPSARQNVNFKLTVGQMLFSLIRV